VVVETPGESFGAGFVGVDVEGGGIGVDLNGVLAECWVGSRGWGGSAGIASV